MNKKQQKYTQNLFVANKLKQKVCGFRNSHTYLLFICEREE